MPVFYFHVHDGEDLPDDEGIDLADVDSARLAAIKLCGFLLRDDAKRFAPGQDWHMEVTDGTGLTLIRLNFAVMQSTSAELPLRPSTNPHGDPGRQHDNSAPGQSMRGTTAVSAVPQ